MTTLGIILFVFAILFSIGLHEFGHFISAKKFGIKVHKFYIGFPPKIWSTQRGETEYGIGAVPLGGFVKIAGMNPYEDLEPEDRDRVFKSKAPWKRAIVLAAGSFTHFVLAFLIIFVTLAALGVENGEKPLRTLRAVDADAPGGKAGLRAGDELRTIDGVPVASWDEAVAVIHQRPGETVPIEVIRDGEPVEVRATLATANPREPDKRIGYLGVGPDYAVERLPLGTAITTSGTTFARWTKDSMVGLTKVFSPAAFVRIFKVIAGTEERRIEDPATVVGITKQAGGLLSGGEYGSFLLVVAAFNIFVGIANLLPLPPLDGGHLAVLAYEKVRKRDVDMRRLLPLTAAVISVLGTMFLLLLYLDIVKPLPSIPG